MKVIYKGTAGAITSGGITFTKGQTFEVSDKVAEYLKSTFGKAFEVEEVKVVAKPKPKAAPKKAKED